MTKQVIKKIYILSLLTIITCLTYGGNFYRLDDDFNYVNIIEHASLFVDTSASLTLDDITTSSIDDQFQLNTEKEPYFKYGKQAVWIQFKVVNESNQHKICYLRYPYPIVRNISIYQFGLNNTLDSTIAGYASENTRNYASNSRPIFKVHLLPSEIKTIYLRFDNAGTEFPLPLKLHSEINLHDKNEYSMIIYGIMYGLILFIILVNCFLFINLRKRIYPYFILYVLTVGFYFSVRDGLAFKYFWNYAEWISSQSLFFGAQLPMIFLLTLTQSSLKTKTYLRQTHKVLQALITLNILLIIYALFQDIPPYILCNFSVLLTFIPIFYASIKTLKQKKLSLPVYFLIAKLSLGSGVFLLLLKNFGYTDYITGELSFRSGFILQLITLTFGLTAMFKNILNQANKTAIENLQQLNKLKDQVNIELETQVEERTQELAQKNIELTNAMMHVGTQRDVYQVERDMIQKQTEETTDSIKYAQQLQKNLTENSQNHLNPFEGFFILNRPKAIVSGDFYWIKKLNNKILVAVADCTGHGVPGAFMSVLGITYLNDIANYDHEVEPAKLLGLLRNKVVEAFSGDNTSNTIAKDGMDISLIAINTDTLELEYAGAYNPLYMVRKTELVTLSGDRMPIGAHEKQNQPFTNHKIQLEKEDKLYLFSDGYIDQFGWRTGKKFKQKQFKQLLLELNDVPIEGQKMVMERTLDNWIGDIEQIDDIMVLGLKI